MKKELLIMAAWGVSLMVGDLSAGCPAELSAH